MIDLYGNSIDIDWHLLSGDEKLNWDVVKIDKCKNVLDWYRLQLNSKSIDLFQNINIILKYQDYVFWSLISCDSRIVWTKELLLKLQSKLEFGVVTEEKVNRSNHPHLNRCFINYGASAGVSMSNKLSKELIAEFIEIWDWKILSSNPALLEVDIFDSPIIQHLDFYGLSHNKGLQLEHLQKLLYYQLNLVDSERRKIEINGINKDWRFDWTYAFENADINWTIDKISLFEEVINDESQPYGNCWAGLSKSITKRDVILKFYKKINFIQLTNSIHLGH